MHPHILIVEDDAIVRGFLDEALYFLDYKVTTAGNGIEALACMQDTTFEVVVTDHHMPGMDGLQLVQTLRDRGFAGRIYVVSGAMPTLARAEYTRLKVDGIATKPLEIVELHRLLGGAVETTQA